MYLNLYYIQIYSPWGSN